VQDGADAEVAAAGAGALVLVGQGVRAGDVSDVDVRGDGVGVGPPGAREVAPDVDVVAAEVEGPLQHRAYGGARHHHRQFQPQLRRRLRRRDLGHHLGAAVPVLHVRLSMIKWSPDRPDDKREREREGG